VFAMRLIIHVGYLEMDGSTSAIQCSNVFLSIMLLTMKSKEIWSSKIEVQEEMYFSPFLGCEDGDRRFRECRSRE
jgi:hypothetical protein